MGLTDPVLASFAEEVGSDGAVACAGGKTQWEVGGLLRAGTREAAAPTGIVAFEPAEMIVRVRAGTPLAELQAAVGAGGQCVWMESDQASIATVGGLLSVGRSGYRRLGRGPLRQTVLEITAVDSQGRLIRGGAPLVKNVTGFDLCRLLVGSLGTLALLAEVVLRCRPLPETELWWVADEVDPFDVAARLYRPLAVLWDGVRTWVGLAGYRVDVDDQARSVLGPRFVSAEGPPPVPAGKRCSMAPATLRGLVTELGSGTGWLAEIGVGVLHCGSEGAVLSGPELSPSVIELHRALKARFDPTDRLNPGRSVLAEAAA
jgi:glycolate oxidase FAD binding subunit